MNDIKRLGKITEIISKILFGLLVALLIVIGFAMQLTKLQSSGFFNKIAVLIGTIIGMAILIFILKLLFKPIYNLSVNIKLRKEGKLNPHQFKMKWLASLICTTIVSLLPIIPSFGISIIIMIPQFMLLTKTKGL